MSSPTFSERAAQCLACNQPSTNSKRTDQFIKGVYPDNLVGSRGCYVWDDQGNRYIDFIGCLGASIVGYCNPRVNEAISNQLSRGALFSLGNEMEVEAAEMVKAMVPWVEKVKFVKTGSEACTGALRYARNYAIKGSRNDLVYSELFHGWHDQFVSLTEPARGVYRGDYGISATESVQSIAIVEPVALDTSASRKERLKWMRVQYPILIFDEIITGLRFKAQTVATAWDIKPDLICLGKAWANGLPIGIIGGPKAIMDDPEVFVSGTFSGEALSLAALVATVKEIQTKDTNLYLQVAQLFMDKLNMALSPIHVRIEGYGTRGMLNVTNPNVALFMQEACKCGMLFGKAYFYTYAHFEEELDHIVFNLIDDIVRRIKMGKVRLEGEMPKEVFKR